MPDLNRDLHSPRRYLDARPIHGPPRRRGRPDRPEPDTHSEESRQRDEHAEAAGEHEAGGREEKRS